MDFLTGLLGSLGGWLLDFVLPSLATIAGTIAVGLLSKLLKKADIELTDKQRDQIKDLVEAAVKSAEEIGHREKLSGPDKRDLARAIIEREAGLKRSEHPEVDDLIDEALQNMRPTPSTPASFGRAAQ